MRDLQKVRNLGVIALIDAGKTTTTEHLLYYAGAKHRLGGVDEGTTETDYDPEEQERGITIYSACVPFEWNGFTVNLIDTPGARGFYRRGRAGILRVASMGRSSCSTARRGSRRSRRRCGGRRISTACHGSCSSTRWTWSGRTSPRRSKASTSGSRPITPRPRAGRCPSSSPFGFGRTEPTVPRPSAASSTSSRTQGPVLRCGRQRQDRPRCGQGHSRREFATNEAKKYRDSCSSTCSLKHDREGPHHLGRSRRAGSRPGQSAATGPRAVPGPEASIPS